MTASQFMADNMEWAATYFGSGNFDLFADFARVLVRLDDWDWVLNRSLSDTADRMGFHGGRVHSRADLATEPTPL